MAATASRSSGRPRIGGYWLAAPVSASAALATTSSGQPKSGKPWPRLTAPNSRAAIDICSKIEVGRLEKIGFMPCRLPSPRPHANRRK